VVLFIYSLLRGCLRGSIDRFSKRVELSNVDYHCGCQSTSDDEVWKRQPAYWIMAKEQEDQIMDSVFRCSFVQVCFMFSGFSWSDRCCPSPVKAWKWVPCINICAYRLANVQILAALRSVRSDNNTAWFLVIGSAENERPRGVAFPWVVAQITRHVIVALRTCAFHLCRIVLLSFRSLIINITTFTNKSTRLTCITRFRPRKKRSGPLVYNNKGFSSEARQVS
jgi:hypothetical protein